MGRARRAPRSCAGLRGAAEPRATGVQRRVGSRDFRGLGGACGEGDRGSPRARWRGARLPAGRGLLRTSAQMDPPKTSPPVPAAGCFQTGNLLLFFNLHFLFYFCMEEPKAFGELAGRLPGITSPGGGAWGAGWGGAGGCGACAGATGAARSREPAPGRCEPPPAAPPSAPHTHLLLSSSPFGSTQRSRILPACLFYSFVLGRVVLASSVNGGFVKRDR